MCRARGTTVLDVMVDNCKQVFFLVWSQQSEVRCASRIWNQDFNLGEDIRTTAPHKRREKLIYSQNEPTKKRQQTVPLDPTLEMEVPRASTMGGVVKAWISITGYITYNYYTVVSSLLSFCAYQTFFLEVLLTCNPLSYRLLVDTVRRPCFV